MIMLVMALACKSSNDLAPKPGPSAIPEASLDVCLPSTANYTLEFTDISDESNENMRSCNARGRIINNGPRDLMFRVFQVNHYGSEDTFGEEWMGTGFMVLKAGESAEYGRFHRCTGGHCGEGEWFYIDRVSIYYYDHGCPVFVNSVEEPHLESVIKLENPCDW
jgi:hypothetical protein